MPQHPPATRRTGFVRAAVLLLALAGARDVPAEEQKAAAAAFPPAIEDNSFFIEEAYNQEKGVVQHISSLVHLNTPGSRYDSSFSQEWPIGGQRHQLSYTLPYAWAASEEDRGMGDVSLNYRYQLVGHDGWAAVAPRLSLLVPSGSRRGGSPGLQVNLPASKRLGARAVVHANAGYTLLASDRGHAYNVGGSAIGLLTRNFNVMLELVSTFATQRDETGGAIRSTETILSPGVRTAVNLGALQIVPGLGVPIRRDGGKTSVGFFAYLSFEHPFDQ